MTAKKRPKVSLEEGMDELTRLVSRMQSGELSLEEMMASYEQGMARISPNPKHMYTYITALFVCDSCDEDARKALKKCRLYKSFKMSYWGWMDFHTGLVVLPEEKISTNASGHCAAQVLERGLFHKQKRSLFRKERAI